MKEFENSFTEMRTAMAEIIVFGGTSEGRKLAEAFADTALTLHLCVATEYGAQLLPKSKNIKLHIGSMDEREMKAFFKETEAQWCLDATHPYAAQATKNIKAACKEAGLSYLRIYREGEFEGQLQEAEGLVYRQSIEEGACFLQNTTGRILITTGSRDLEAYTCIESFKERLFIRILPGTEILEKCQALGFEKKNIIAMQGPFEEEFNYALLKQIKAEWLVTKDGGREGGYKEKCRAAARAGVKLMVIGRPEEEEERAMGLLEAIAFLHTVDGTFRRKATIVSMGPGNPELLTAEAKRALEESQVILGAERILEIWPQARNKIQVPIYKKEEIVAFLEEHPEYERVALVYSGDIGFYSGAKGIGELLPDYEIQWIPGIASPIYFLDRLGLSWNEAVMTSCHGQRGNLLSLIKKEKKVVSLFGKKEDISQISQELLAASMGNIKITVGQRLSYPEEQIFSGYPEEFKERPFDALAVAMFENPEPERKRIGFGMPDEAFVRGRVPMTKEEIRVLSLEKLGLFENSILYDVGAGTGSVSVEAALGCPGGCVYGIEKEKEAIRLMKENKRRFGAENLVIVEGSAPEALEELPPPTHAFIGGSSGRLVEIIQKIRRKNKKVRFVMNVVTLETLALLEEIKRLDADYEDMEAVQVSTAKNRSLGHYQLMTAQNPVFIISFGGKGGEG